MVNIFAAHLDHSSTSSCDRSIGWEPRLWVMRMTREYGKYSRERGIIVHVSPGKNQKGKKGKNRISLTTIILLIPVRLGNHSFMALSLSLSVPWNYPRVINFPILWRDIINGRYFFYFSSSSSTTTRPLQIISLAWHEIEFHSICIPYL